MRDDLADLAIDFAEGVTSRGIAVVCALLPLWLAGFGFSDAGWLLTSLVVAGIIGAAWLLMPVFDLLWSGIALAWIYLRG